MASIPICKINRVFNEANIRIFTKPCTYSIKHAQALSISRSAELSMCT